MQTMRVDDRTSYCGLCSGHGMLTEGISYCFKCQNHLCFTCARQHLYKCSSTFKPSNNLTSDGINTGGVSCISLQPSVKSEVYNPVPNITDDALKQHNQAHSNTWRGTDGTAKAVSTSRPTFSAHGGIVKVLRRHECDDDGGSNTNSPRPARLNPEHNRRPGNVSPSGSVSSSIRNAAAHVNGWMTNDSPTDAEKVKAGIEEMRQLCQQCHTMSLQLSETVRQLERNSGDMETEVYEYQDTLMTQINDHVKKLNVNKSELVGKQKSVSKKSRDIIQNMANGIETVVKAAEDYIRMDDMVRALHVIERNRKLINDCKTTLQGSGSIAWQPMVYLEKNGAFVNRLSEPGALGQVLVVDRRAADSSRMPDYQENALNHPMQKFITLPTTAVPQCQTQCQDVIADTGTQTGPNTTGKNILIDTLNLEKFGQFDSNEMKEKPYIIKDDVPCLPLQNESEKNGKDCSTGNKFHVRHSDDTLNKAISHRGDQKYTSKHQGKIILYDGELWNDSSVNRRPCSTVSKAVRKPSKRAWESKSNTRETVDLDPRKHVHSRESLLSNHSKIAPVPGRNFADDLRRALARDENDLYDETASVESAEYDTKPLKKRTAKIMKFSLNERQSRSGKGCRSREGTPSSSQQRYTHPAQSKLTLVKRMMVKLPSDSTHCEINSIDCMPDGRLVMSDPSNMCVKVFHHFKPGAAILRLEEVPHALAVVSHTALAVLCGMAFDKLLIVNVGKELTVKRCFKIGTVCRDICADDTRIYLLCSRNYETEVLVMDTEGAVSSKLKFGHILNAPKNIGVCRVSGKLYITDACAGVFIADLPSRQVKQCIDNSVERYHGVAVDFDHNVFVCCGNPDGVREVSSVDKYLMPVLGGSDVTNVTYICHNYNNNTMVVGGNCSDFVKIYQLQKSTNEKRH